MNKNLICDLDGVICNFVKAYSTIMNDMDPKYPIITDYEMVKTWEWDTWYPASKEILDEAWNKILKIKNFWAINLPPIDENTVEELYKISHLIDIYFVTSRSDTEGFSVLWQSQLWLENHGFHNPTVIPCKEKHNLAKLLNADFFIDDKPDYYFNNSLDGKKYEILGLIDYPYNRLEGLNPATKRFKNLSSFIEHLKNFI